MLCPRGNRFNFIFMLSVSNVKMKSWYFLLRPIFGHLAYGTHLLSFQNVMSLLSLFIEADLFLKKSYKNIAMHFKCLILSGSPTTFETITAICQLEARSCVFCCVVSVVSMSVFTFICSNEIPEVSNMEINGILPFYQFRSSSSDSKCFTCFVCLFSFCFVFLSNGE